MIAIHNVVAASATVGLLGREGQVIRMTVIPTAYYLLASGILALLAVGGEPCEQALAAFHAKWRHEPLVLDKWFSVQARDPSENALSRVLALTGHADFDAGNPNRFRALVQGFASANPARFPYVSLGTDAS